MKTRLMIVVLSICFALTCCKKDKGTLSSVETLDTQFIASTSATISYHLVSDGGKPISSSGIIIGLDQNLETSGNNYEMGTDTGTYVGKISGLTPNTQYFIKAFSINEIGNSYGELKSFVTPAKISDYDGNLYKTVIIGDQVWMAENLKTTSYQNGNPIETTSPFSLNIENETNPKYQWIYNNDNTNLADYGRLYTWYTATDTRNVCPNGWHVPTDSEWTTLESTLGGYAVAGSKLKEISNDHWLEPYNVDANDISCFTGLPGGYRDWNGSFYQIRNDCYFWSTLESEPVRAYSRTLNVSSPSVGRLGLIKSYGISIRCIKD